MAVSLLSLFTFASSAEPRLASTGSTRTSTNSVIVYLLIGMAKMRDSLGVASLAGGHLFFLTNRRRAWRLHSIHKRTKATGSMGGCSVCIFDTYVCLCKATRIAELFASLSLYYGALSSHLVVMLDLGFLVIWWIWRTDAIAQLPDQRFLLIAFFARLISPQQS
ncbi:hypothetical protein K458DRAFT_173602 [Lentithecium fluviatile CBS 122367]|uniref:Secreted protein n=1 Tax=Lentithecium fluviatile CBS 122367 TaxID=1168545 RepID=A0A6G1JC28_9PLEO|nr:hypothetical protein K458DRAFT_173602 [Lentithecium fluviatile CBS 122367]